MESRPVDGGVNRVRQEATMALETLRSVLARRPVPAEAVRWSASGAAAVADDPMVAGGVDRQVAPCPRCGRPNLRGSGRCTGCGVRLLFDLPLAKAGSLLAIGLFAGLVLGGGAVGAIAVVNAPAAPAASAEAGGPAGSRPTSAPVLGTVPSGAGAALRAASQINGRLAAAAEPLAAALGARRFSASDVAKVLRQMRVDLRAGTALLPVLDPWDAAAAYQADLAAFYGRLDDAIAKALAASTTSNAPYKTAARSVIQTLRGVAALDEAGRALGASGGLTLDPIEIPDALRE